MRPIRAAALAFVLVGVFLAAHAAAEAPPAPGPRLVGMAIALPDDKGGSLVFGQNRGVKLTFRVARGDAAFLGLDEDACKLTKFADDKGADLANGKDWLWSFPSIAQDKHAITFDVKAEKTPSPGAREIALVAAVGVRVGSDPQVAEQDLALAEGSKVAIGPIPFQVKSVTKAKSRKSGVCVEFTSSRSLEELGEIEFLAADGRAVKTDLTSSGGFSMNGVGSFSRTYVFDEALASVKLRLRWFAKVETQLVPIDARIGVGF
jgi:hypothetical protein